MYPRLSSNKAIMVRDQIDSARTAGVPLDDLLKQDLKNLLSNVENGESQV
jgi:hypothetical protein